MKDQPPNLTPQADHAVQTIAERIASFPRRRRQGAAATAPGGAENPTGDAPRSEERRPAVGMRVDAARRDEFDALRPLYPSADGANGTRSDVLRAMVDIGFAIVGDPKIHERLKRDATAQGISLGELLRQRMKTAGALK